MRDSVHSTPTHRPWTPGRVVGYTLLIAAVYLLAQTAALFAVAAPQYLADPGFDIAEWIESGESNGLMLSVAAIAATIVCCPYIVYLVRRSEPDPSSLLGFRTVGIRTIAGWCALLVLFVAVSDLLTLSLGRPIVPDIVVADFLSGPPVLLFLAIVLFAPLFEELFFRGFLMGTLRSLGVRPWSAIAVSAALFSIVHIQYDLYGMVSILAMALLLGMARWKSGSVVPCMAMHAVANLIAFAETVYLVQAAD